MIALHVVEPRIENASGSIEIDTVHIDVVLAAEVRTTSALVVICILKPVASNGVYVCVANMKNRAWTVLNGKGIFIHFKTGEEREFDWEIFDEEVTFDRYSGINDVTGKEIYENDLIAATIPGFGGGGVSRALVSFEVGCFGIRLINEFIPLFKLEDLKISGHIHK